MNNEQAMEEAFKKFNRLNGSPMSPSNDDYGKYRHGFINGWQAAMGQVKEEKPLAATFGEFKIVKDTRLPPGEIMLVFPDGRQEGIKC